MTDREVEEKIYEKFNVNGDVCRFNEYKDYLEEGLNNLHSYAKEKEYPLIWNFVQLA
jgi:hypothetical protein